MTNNNKDDIKSVFSLTLVFFICLAIFWLKETGKKKLLVLVIISIIDQRQKWIMMLLPKYVCVCVVCVLVSATE